MRELGEGIRRIFELMEQSDLHDPVLEVSSTDFSVAMSNKSVFTDKQEQDLALFDEYNVSRLQTRILALGLGGNDIAPDDIYKAMNTKDRDTYDHEVTALLQSRLLVQIRTNAEANAFKKQHNLSKGKVPRFRVVVPSVDRRNDGILGGGPRVTDREMYELHPERCVYVGNLPPDVSNERVRGFFEVCGPVDSIVLPVDKLNSQLERFCFVKFASSNGAHSALKTLDGKTMDQHAIRVKPYSPPTKPLYRGRSA